MLLHTASEGIAFAKGLEKESATFYEELATRWPAEEETFLAFASANRKNVAEIDRTYYGVITDAIEGGFCFDLDPASYVVHAQPFETTSIADAVTAAIASEETIIRFYSDAVEQSKPLMADVPRVFVAIAKKHQKRLAALQAMFEKEV